MIYLRDNPLLREPLKAEHIKKRLLGHWGTSPGLSFTYVHLNRLINKYDLERDLPRRPGPRRAGRAGAGLPRRHVLRGLPEQGRRRGRDARVLQGVLLPRRHRQPLHAGDARLDPRRRRARLQRLARVRRGVRQPGSARHRRGRRRRSRDRPARDVVALQQVPQPDPRRRGAADPSSQRLQDQQPHAPRRASRTKSSRPLQGLRLDAALRRGRRPDGDAPEDGRDDGGVRAGDPPHPAGGARKRQADSRALADDRAAHPQGLDRPEGSGRPQGRGLLARRTRCRWPACTRTPRT